MELLTSLLVNKDSNIFSQYTIGSYDAVNENTDQQKKSNWSKLEKLAKVNIFIGENNSGKSRFLRALFESFYDFQNRLKQEDIPMSNTSGRADVEPPSWNIDFKNQDGVLLESKIRDTLEQLLSEIENQTIIKPTINVLNELLTYCNFGKASFHEVKYIIEILLNLQYNTRRLYSTPTTNGSVLQAAPEDQTKSQEIITSLHQYAFDFYKELFQSVLYYNPTYIPVLRSLQEKHIVGNFNEFVYTDYFDGSGDISEHIFTGQTMYKRIRRLLEGRGSEKRKKEAFEQFISKNFFDHKEFVMYAPKEDTNVKSSRSEVLTIELDGKERAIQDIGDGIKAIIILAFTIFENRDKPHALFIDEPELYLHPGLQRVFINTISKFENLQVFITTHSNHFLDMTFEAEHDISVYTFKKKKGETEAEESFIIENVSNADHNVLDLIGVRNSSVFLSNCTIWVEGISDRIYIRKYLELYQAKLADKLFLEDLHYSFVEYGGGNITHWSFLDDEHVDDDTHRNINVDRLCGKLFLIADNDGDTKTKRHEQLQEKLGPQQYFRLEKSREIENLLPPSILKQTLQDYNCELDITDIRHTDYQEEKMGTYLSTIATGKSKDRFDSKSGTIGVPKRQFAQRAVSHMQKFEDLSEEAQTLTKKIYEFIKEKNG